MAGMNTKNWRRSAMLGVALAAIALPASAMAQDADADHMPNGGRGGEAAGRVGEQSEGGWRHAPVERQADDGERQPREAARPAPGPQAQARVQTQADAQAQPSAAGGGWRARNPDATGGDRRAEGGRWGRDWSNGGTVARPAETAQGSPAIPDRQSHGGAWGQRNGTYSDPARSGSYREVNRDGRTGEGWRDHRQQQGGYRAGYASGSTDPYRRDGSRYDDNRHTWDRDWRRDNRYNWYSYRSQNRSLFNIGFYNSPYRNYSYRRLNIGFYLDSQFYGNRYWINDPWQYRLPEVYGPYRWVRYYDDALLVDVYSGEVVDAIYNFFW